MQPQESLYPSIPEPGKLKFVCDGHSLAWGHAVGVYVHFIPWSVAMPHEH